MNNNCESAIKVHDRQPVVLRQKRRVSYEEVILIRDCAHAGHSLSSTARILGIYPQQLTGLLNDAQIDDIRFVPGTQSLAFRSNLAALHAGRRGRPQPNQSPEVYAALARGREATRQKHMRSAFGINGTVKELMEHFECELTRNGIYQRLQRGMTLEEALTTKSMIRSEGIEQYLPDGEVMRRARKYASQGHSFSFTAQLLGMTRKRLCRILKEANATIQFVPGMQSLAVQANLQALHESNRGKLRGPAAPAILAGGARGREARGCKRYTAFSVTGYLRELKEHFDCTLNIKTLRSRIKSGMSAEDALTKPAYRAQRGVCPPQFYDRLIKRRTMEAAAIMLIARKRVTPTMLQYHEPDHDIVVTARALSHITVEVRTQTGEVLHRLRFIKSFESGVLFVFNPKMQDRIQFIAFEPDSEALQEAEAVAG